MGSLATALSGIDVYLGVHLSSKGTERFLSRLLAALCQAALCEWGDGGQQGKPLHQLETWQAVLARADPGVAPSGCPHTPHPALPRRGAPGPAHGFLGGPFRRGQVHLWQFFSQGTLNIWVAGSCYVSCEISQGLGNTHVHARTHTEACTRSFWSLLF